MKTKNEQEPKITKTMGERMISAERVSFENQKEFYLKS